MYSLHSLIHIRHQEWIMKIIKARAEKRTRLLKGMYTALNKKFRQNGIHSKFRRKLSHIACIDTFTQFPYLFYCHIPQR